MILRRKLYSQEENPNRISNEDMGEALGTVALGTTGSIVASKYGKKAAEGISSAIEGKKAVAAFRKGAKSAMENRINADKDALLTLENFKKNNKGGLFGFGKKKALNKAREAYRNSIGINKTVYNNSIRDLRRSIVSNKNKNIAKAGRRGKIGTLVTGLGITGLLTGSKLLKNKNKSNTKE